MIDFGILFTYFHAGELEALEFAVIVLFFIVDMFVLDIFAFLYPYLLFVLGIFYGIAISFSITKSIIKKRVEAQHKREEKKNGDQ